jgi:hypothetical protein
MEEGDSMIHVLWLYKSHRKNEQKGGGNQREREKENRGKTNKRTGAKTHGQEQERKQRRTKTQKVAWRKKNTRKTRGNESSKCRENITQRT